MSRCCIVASVNWLQTISFLDPSHVSTGYRPPIYVKHFLRVSLSPLSSHSSLCCLPVGHNAPLWYEFSYSSSLPVLALSLHVNITTCDSIFLQYFLLISPMQGRELEMTFMQGNYTWDKAKFLRDLARSIRQRLLNVHGEVHCYSIHGSNKTVCIQFSVIN